MLTVKTPAANPSVCSGVFAIVTDVFSLSVTSTAAAYALSLHAALPICAVGAPSVAITVSVGSTTASSLGAIVIVADVVPAVMVTLVAREGARLYPAHAENA